uniref:Intraflagellar transport associated protein n=1 Tax=Nannospalax galili TaxID=1026970 RepID=A0A8C6RJ95_NANGA
EQDVSTGVPAHVPCVDQPLTSEILGDEVQPFSLDEEFDYENVALTPKFSFEEIETIKESSNQKGKDTNLDWGPHY